jgi:putative peptidoglycan lipid II flippase
VVGAGILAGNITGFFRVAVTAYLVGTHARADALAVAIGPIDTLNQAVINTMLVSLVPMLMLRPESDRAAIFARAGRAFAGILIGIGILVALLAPQIISLLGPGLAPDRHDEAVTLLRLLAPATVFSGGSAIFAALLYTGRRFVAPSLYQACLNGGTIAAALTLWKWLGLNSFAIGYVAGSCVQLFATWWLSRDLRRSDSSHAPIAWKQIFATPCLYLLYAAMISANIIATRAFATHAGPGMAAAFDYCLKCISVVVAYLVYPVANSLLPEIARLRGIGRMGRAYGLIDKSLALMAILSVAACVIGVLLRTQVISLLFERGSFTGESTLLVSNVFLGFAPAIIAWSMLDLMSRCFFALDRPRLPVIASVLPMIVNLAVMALLSSAHNPEFLAAGASAGLTVACGYLFMASSFNRKAVVTVDDEAARDFSLISSGTKTAR